MRLPKPRFTRYVTAAACALGLVGAACTDTTDVPGEPPPPEAEVNPLASGADFVAIPRTPDPASAARRSGKARALPPADTSESFYLAIRRAALPQRWFLSAFLAQYFPEGPAFNGAGRSLGTRVVSFRIQNDKLFMFDAGDGHAASSVFDPELLIESYPIVAVPGFAALRGAQDYVLVDPAAGLNRFSVMSDTLAPSLPHEGVGAPNRFQVDLAYLQRFRQLADGGVTFEQLFTGYTERPVNDGPLDPNAYQLSGTLALSLRPYGEGAGFVPVAAPAQSLYFVGPPQLDGQGNVAPRKALHFNIHPGMQPIPWLISPVLVDYVAAHPELAAVDVVGAVKQGVESWNDAFGFPVFTAQVAAPTDSFADDDRNYLIFDPSPALGYAFASARANPNTGETRGATVLFGSAWLNTSGFHDDPGATPTALSLPPAPAAAPARLGWEAMPDASLCELRADEALVPSEATGALALTAPAKMHAFLAHTIAHEIGHTLGLRHNFKGSLVPPSSSTMDYLNQADSIALPGAGAYDVDAIRYLYGLSTTLPAQPFCTDENVKADPSCQAFDHGADPIGTYAGAWGSYWNYVLSTGNLAIDDAFDYYGHGLMAFVRAGVGGEPQRAYDLLTHLIRPPIAANLAQIPSFGAGADFISRAIFKSLYGKATNQFSRVLVPPSDPTVLASLLADLRGNLLNLDGVRSFDTRRLCVDVLKQLQNVTAYQALLDAHDALVTRISALVASGQNQVELALTRDLLARVDQATTPYFQ